jgi:hypothetical protein
MRATWARQAVGVILSVTSALILSVATGAQAPDPLVGMWHLDVAKSTYKPGPAPKSATVVITAAGKGLNIAIDAVGGDGKPLKWSYANNRDGKETPVTGNPAYDAVSVAQTSPTEGTISYKKGGKTIVTAKTSVSKDGKTLTVTTTGTDPMGQAMNNVAVYTKM